VIAMFPAEVKSSTSAISRLLLTALAAFAAWKSSLGSAQVLVCLEVFAPFAAMMMGSEMP
jgi:hypothetical protein